MAQPPREITLLLRATAHAAHAALESAAAGCYGGRIMRSPFVVFLGLAAFLLFTGFDEEDLQRVQVSQREDIRQLKEKIGQLQSDMQARTGETETLKADVVRLKAEQTQWKKDLERIEGLIKALDAARQQDRKIIIEEVGREIARIKGGGSSSSGASGSKSKPPAGKPPKSAPDKTAVQEGYEHVVRKGEYLAAIAEAYGVTVKEIKEANQLKSNELAAGQKLFIPKKKKK